MKQSDLRRSWYERSARIALLAVAAEIGNLGPAWSQEPAADQVVEERAADNSPADSTADSTTSVVNKPAEISLLSDGGLSDEVWQFVSHEKATDLAGTWQVQQSDGESVLICRGKPYGYLKTTKAFTDFQLKLEWKFPEDANGNSGILLYTNGQEKGEVWPTAMQVQLHQPVCGSIFPSGDARSDNEIRDVRDVCKSVNQWNSCEITSVGGRLAVEMNGKPVGVVTGCHPDNGGIALQSEGSEIHFRRIWVRELVQAKTSHPSVSQIPLRHRHASRRGGPVGFSIPELTFGPVEYVNIDGRRPHLDRMNTHVVHRDCLAADGHFVRARRREPGLVVEAPADQSFDRRAVVRVRYRRELHR